MKTPETVERYSELDEAIIHKRRRYMLALNILCGDTDANSLDSDELMYLGYDPYRQPPTEDVRHKAKRILVNALLREGHTE